MFLGSGGVVSVSTQNNAEFPLAHFYGKSSGEGSAFGASFMSSHGDSGVFGRDGTLTRNVDLLKIQEHLTPLNFVRGFRVTSPILNHPLYNPPNTSIFFYNRESELEFLLGEATPIGHLFVHDERWIPFAEASAKRFCDHLSQCCLEAELPF